MGRYTKVDGSIALRTGEYEPLYLSFPGEQTGDTRRGTGFWSFTPSHAYACFGTDPYPICSPDSCGNYLQDYFDAVDERFDYLLAHPDPPAYPYKNGTIAEAFKPSGAYKHNDETLFFLKLDQYCRYEYEDTEEVLNASLMTGYSYWNEYSGWTTSNPCAKGEDWMYTFYNYGAAGEPPGATYRLYKDAFDPIYDDEFMAGLGGSTFGAGIGLAGIAINYGLLYYLAFTGWFSEPKEQIKAEEIVFDGEDRVVEFTRDGVKGKILHKCNYTATEHSSSKKSGTSGDMQWLPPDDDEEPGGLFIYSYAQNGQRWDSGKITMDFEAVTIPFDFVTRFASTGGASGYFEIILGLPYSYGSVTIPIAGLGGYPNWSPGGGRVPEYLAWGGVIDINAKEYGYSKFESIEFKTHAKSKSTGNAKVTSYLQVQPQFYIDHSGCSSSISVNSFGTRIEGTATSGSGSVQRVQYKINDGNWKSATDESGSWSSWSCQINADNLTSGTNRVRFRSISKCSNGYGTTSVCELVELDPDQIPYVTVEDGLSVKLVDRLEFLWDICGEGFYGAGKDEADFAYYFSGDVPFYNILYGPYAYYGERVLYVDGNDANAHLTGSVNDFTWNSTSVSDGKHDLELQLTHTSTTYSGEPASASTAFEYTVWVDNSGKLKATLKDTLEDTGLLILHGAATDGDGDPVNDVSVRIGDGSWTTAADPLGDWSSWGFLLDETTLDHGTVPVSVRAEAGGDYSSVAEYYAMNNEAPIVDIDASYSVIADSLTITGTASDPDEHGVSFVYAKIDGGAWTPVLDTSGGTDYSTWEVTFDGVSSGLHVLQAVAYDTLSAPSPYDEHLMDTRVTPYIDLEVVDKKISADLVYFEGTAGDADDGISAVEVNIDSTSWVSATDISQAADWSRWKYEWDLSSVPDGPHVVSMRAYNGIGYSDTIGTLIRINRPPTVAIDSYQISGDIITFDGTTGDVPANTVEAVYCITDPGIDELVLVDDTTLPSGWNLATDVSDSADWDDWQYAWDVSGESDGNHVVYAIAFNGHTFSEMVNISLTYHHPVVELLEPQGGEVWNGTGASEGYFRWRAHDPDGDALTFTLKYSTGDGGWATFFADSSIADSSVNIPNRVANLADAETYIMRLTAKDDDNMEGHSQTPRKLIVDYVTPPVWEKTTGAQWAESNGSNITVFWNGAEDASPPITYNVYYDTLSPLNFGTANVDVDVQTQSGGTYEYSYTVTGLDPACKRYYLAVRAQDSAINQNEDSNTNEVSAVTSYATPGTGVNWTLQHLSNMNPTLITMLRPNYYVATCGFTISQSDELVIMEGDTLAFNDNTGAYTIKVIGTLTAIGQPRPIVFRAQSSTSKGAWGGIDISSNGSAQFDNCRFYHADKAISTRSSNVTVDFCTFSTNTVGVATLEGSRATVRNSTFAGNTTGVEAFSSSHIGPNNSISNSTNGVYAGSSPEIFRNLITGNYTGIVFAGSGALTVAWDNDINSNTGYGISVGSGESGCSPKILGNRVQSNGSSGIMCWQDARPYIGVSDSTGQGNLIQSNSGYGVDCLQASPTLDGNTISGNASGGISAYSGMGAGSVVSMSRNIVSNNGGALGVGLYIDSWSSAKLGNLENSIFEDDGGNEFTNHSWHVDNRSYMDIMAQGNYWGSTDSSAVDSTIRDDDENASYGEVVFMPLIDNPNAPDLTASGTDLSFLRTGNDLTVTGRVWNRGRTASGGFYVEFGTDTTQVGGDEFVDDVPAESSTTVSVVWTDGALIDSTVEVSMTIDPGDSLVDERNEDNNTASTYIGPPEVTLHAPERGEPWSGAKTVKWHGYDAEGDSLTYDVWISVDGGSNWIALASATSQEELQLDTSVLTSTYGNINHALLKVQADDGVFLSEPAISDTFHLVNNRVRPITLFDTGQPEAVAEDTLAVDTTFHIVIPESVDVIAASMQIEVEHHEYIDQEQKKLENLFTGVPVEGNSSVAQLFRPASSLISAVDIYGQGTGEKWVISINADAGGPDPVPLSEAIVIAEASTVPRWYHVDLPDVELQSGVEYFLHVTGFGGTVPTFGDRFGTYDAYANGYCIATDDGGETWDFMGTFHDIGFRTWTEVDPDSLWLDIGNDGDQEWFSGTQSDTIFNITDLAGELGGYIGTHVDADDGVIDGKISVPIRAHSSDEIKLTVLNANVVYVDALDLTLGEEQVAAYDSGSVWFTIRSLSDRTYYVTGIEPDGSIPHIYVLDSGCSLIDSLVTSEVLHPLAISRNDDYYIQTVQSTDTEVGLSVRPLSDLEELNARSSTLTDTLLYGGPDSLKNLVDLYAIKALTDQAYSVRLAADTSLVDFSLFDLDGNNLSTGGKQADDEDWWGPHEPATVPETVILSVFGSGSLSGGEGYRLNVLAGDQPIAIGDAFVDADSSGIPDSLGRLVTVQGVVMFDSDTFGDAWREFTIQDSTGAAFIMELPTQVDSLREGDEILASGIVSQSFGRSRLRYAVATAISTGNPTPDPVLATTGGVSSNGEVFENKLIEIFNVEIVSGTWPGEGENGLVTIDDGSGELELVIDADTDIDGYDEPAGSFDVRGIAAQWDTIAPYTDRYRIVPRGWYDFSGLNTAPDYFALVYPLNDSSVDTVYPTFVWNEATDADSGDTVRYTLRYWEESTTETTVVFSILDTTHTAESALENDAYYRWSLSAWDGKGGETYGSGSDVTPWRFQVHVPVPDIDVSPSLIGRTVYEGEERQFPMVIRNTGDASLSFSISDDEVFKRRMTKLPDKLTGSAVTTGSDGFDFAGLCGETVTGNADEFRFPGDKPLHNPGVRAANEPEYLRKVDREPQAPFKSIEKRADASWLTADPDTGTVPPADSATVIITLDASGVAADIYNADLTIANDDPDENPVTVPVTMRVPRMRFADHDAGNLVLTVTDEGAFGFWDRGQSASYGHGFVYPSDGNDHLFHGGIWVGTDTTNMSDGAYDYDFEVVEGGEIVIAETDVEYGWAQFDDSNSSSPLSVEITQHSWAWADTPYDDYVVLQYAIENNSGAGIDDLYIGLYMDWDVGGSTDNEGAYDSATCCGYMFDDGADSSHVGLVAIDPDTPSSFRFVHNPTYVHPYGMVRDVDKYAFMSGAVIDTLTWEQADWSMVMVYGPHDFEDGQSLDISFAVVGGEGKSDLLANALAARSKAATYIAEERTPTSPSRFMVHSSSPNPARDRTVISYEIPRSQRVSAEIFDVTGRLVRRLAGGVASVGRHSVQWDCTNEAGKPVSPGIYFCRVSTEDKARASKIVVLR
jgi:hypothetical protein